jgi:hypothetical protein
MTKRVNCEVPPHAPPCREDTSLYSFEHICDLASYRTTVKIEVYYRAMIEKALTSHRVLKLINCLVFLRINPLHTTSHLIIKGNENFLAIQYLQLSVYLCRFQCFANPTKIPGLPSTGKIGGVHGSEVHAHPLSQGNVLSRCLGPVDRRLVRSSCRGRNEHVLESVTHIVLECAEVKKWPNGRTASADRDTQLAGRFESADVVSSDDFRRLKSELEVSIAVLELAETWILASCERLLLATLLILLHGFEASWKCPLQADSLQACGCEHAPESIRL